MDVIHKQSTSMESAVTPRRHSRAAAPGTTLFVLCLLACGSGLSGCQSSNKPIYDEAKISLKAENKTEIEFPADEVDYFADMDVGWRPENAYARLEPLHLKHDEIKGRNTWMLWTGGNEAFWDWLANHSYGFVDLLKLVDFNPEHPWDRFGEAGLIVEPNTRPPLTADRYGLYIRQPSDETARQPSEEIFGRSSGIVGLRLYPNPLFDADAAKRWDALRYYNDPTYYLDPTLVRPYRVGMTCGLCHVGPNPMNPPPNVEEPNWSNLSATIGNQYLRTRKVFGNMLEADTYFYHVLDSQLPGSLDTSLIASDNINNANSENAIWELGGRLDRAGVFDHRKNKPGYEQDYRSRYSTNLMERVGDSAANLPVFLAPDQKGGAACGDTRTAAVVNPRPVPRVLLDGSDSIGAWMSLARVYLNIGTYHQRWVTLHNPLFGYRNQKPFKLADADDGSAYWAATKCRMNDLMKYLLEASWPMRLRDAPGGKAHVKGEGVPWAQEQELKRGRSVFAARCIVCHSSKQPKIFDKTEAGDVLNLLTNPEYKEWAEDAVEREEFWQENYLSTDRRLPVSLVETNASRALASNSIINNVWEEFSSTSYKELPVIDRIEIWNPFKRRTDKITDLLNTDMRDRGRGYYRPASLVSVWATAPLLHNNSVGLFNNDPSVEGRLEAFNDAINKLLTPGQSDDEAAAARWRLGSRLNGATSRRLEDDHGLIWRLPQPAVIRIPKSQLAYFVASLAGWPVAAVEWSWVVPFAILVLAMLCLVSSRRLFRRLGYGLTIIAFVFAGVASFLAGHLVDLTVGPLPAGLPVDVVANIDPDRVKSLAALPSLIRAGRLIHEINRMPPGIPATDRKIDDLGQLLHELSKSPDYVMDRGHYFGRELTEQERRDLIDLLLTF
jgi:hypothetical protein